MDNILTMQINNSTITPNGMSATDYKLLCDLVDKYGISRIMTMLGCVFEDKYQKNLEDVEKDIDDALKKNKTEYILSGTTNG